MTGRLIKRLGWNRALAAIVAIAALASAPALAQKAGGKAPAAPRREEPAVASTGAPGGEAPVLEGSMTPKTILNVAPAWRQEFMAYHPDQATLDMLREYAKSLGKDVKVEVVIGTWCSDSQREVPRFIKMQRALRPNRLPVSYWGVDRTKQNPGEAVQGRGIEKVPTFIVYYRGEEIGRITEKPAVSVEADMADILSRAGAKG